MIAKVILISGFPRDIQVLLSLRTVEFLKPAEVSFTLSLPSGLQWVAGALVGDLGNLISQGHHSSAFDLGPDQSLADL